MARFRVLIVDDDPCVLSLVSDALSASGCEAVAAKSLAAGRRRLEEGGLDLLVLDRHLPDGDGLAFCATLREEGRLERLPVLFLTARTAVEDRVEGLQAGDDYLTKPFAVEEFLARVSALLRRSRSAGQAESLEAGLLRMDKDARRTWVGKTEIELTEKEFDLLAIFLSLKERVLSRDFLLQEIWGTPGGSQVATKTVDVTISNLRAKLGDEGRRIVTVRGHGYRFDP